MGESAPWKIESGAMSATNKLGNRILSLSATLLFFKKTTDLCTGFWGFRSKTLEGLHLTAEGFSLEADLFCSVAKKGVKTLEIPIDYTNREGVQISSGTLTGPKFFSKHYKRDLEDLKSSDFYPEKNSPVRRIFYNWPN